MTLLIDCSGCGYSIHPVTFSHKQESDTETTSAGPAPGLNAGYVDDNDIEDREVKLTNTNEPTNLDHLSEMPFLVLGECKKNV